MASTYTNNGPIYLTQAKYDAKEALGEIVPGQEYRITDWTAANKDAFDQTIQNLCSTLGLTGTQDENGIWSFTK